jgi:hypothetical protein
MYLYSAARRYILRCVWLLGFTDSWFPSNVNSETGVAGVTDDFKSTHVVEFPSMSLGFEIALNPLVVNDY